MKEELQHKVSQTISKTINTLNNIEVHGKQNLDRLLGCILVLENLMKECESDVREKN